ncbi:MAG: nicotinate dehydrogenase subunit [Methylobacteriaceae bacterium]|jgi:CO/xanthine dehydrogenase Mo-binding subunit|nr:nicotinate dehydrogenase subunit [Methylobacteriaceae bacterium]
MNAPLFTPSRRQLLTGAIVVSFSLRALPSFGQEQQNTASKPKLPGSLKDAPTLDSWIRIDADGTVTVFTGKCEIGQGIKTALIQVAAEELGLEPNAIRLVTADTTRTANEGFTSGSHSMQDSGTAIRNAAAQVRELLIGIAAERLGIAADQLHAQSGAVVAPDNRRIAYGDLVAGDVLHVAAQPTSKLKSPDALKVIGQSMPRVDIPGKVTGGVSYVQDLRLPGMVHARIVRPPSYGARLQSLDASAIEKMPGVIKIVRDGSFLGVIAEREFQAITAMHVLAAAAKWDAATKLPDEKNIFSVIGSLPANDYVIADNHAASAPAARSLEAVYRRPYQLHGSIGPSCAVASFDGDALTVWSHAQGMFPLRKAIAEMLHLSDDKVRCIHMEGAGCYGHNGADDAAADAALLARALPGRPVRVQWMREQEHQWEPYGPAMIGRARASLDAGGNIVDWQYEVRSNTHSTRPPGAGQLLAARHLEQPFKPGAPKPIPQPEGGGDRNSIPLYALPNVNVVHHFVPDMPLRVSAQRGLGAYHNIFAIESFMDELAAAAGADPVEFRLRHMQEKRARKVITTAAERFGWSSTPLPKGKGRGFAFAQYKNLGAYCAVAIEVDVEHESGRVRLGRAVAAVDSGQAVNPDGIANQIQGGIVQSASWTLYESVRFDETRILSQDWSTYPILRFGNVPESVDVHVIDAPGEPFLGTGEAAQGPTAAAIANAVANATGMRIRDLPLSAARVKEAIGV